MSVLLTGMSVLLIAPRGPLAPGYHSVRTITKIANTNTRRTRREKADYFGVGSCIDRSKSDAGKEVPPFRLALSAATIAQFAAQQAMTHKRPNAGKFAMVAGFLQLAGKQDHITVTSQPIPNGVRVRLKFEEGLLKVLGGLAPMGNPPPRRVD